MFIVLGATGHVGSATTEALLERGQSVTVVTRDESRAERFRDLGAEIAQADIHDVETMRSVFRVAKRLFLLNPPAAPSTNTDATEKETAHLLLAAIEGSGLEKIVAESTYGAQPGHQIGDLNTLYELEEGLRAQSIPHTIIRAAYYFSNWDAMLEPARTGVLPTMYPADLKLPMVAPADLGDTAAKLLLEPAQRRGIHYVEGPERYSSADVADAFSKALGRTVTAVATPREDWERAYRRLGFSDAAARSYARMTALTADGSYEMPDNPERGATTLQTYIESLVEGAGSK